MLREGCTLAIMVSSFSAVPTSFSSVVILCVRVRRAPFQVIRVSIITRVFPISCGFLCQRKDPPGIACSFRFFMNLIDSARSCPCGNWLLRQRFGRLAGPYYLMFVTRWSGDRVCLSPFVNVLYGNKGFGPVWGTTLTPCCLALVFWASLSELQTPLPTRRTISIDTPFQWLSQFWDNREGSLGTTDQHHKRSREGDRRGGFFPPTPSWLPQGRYTRSIAAKRWIVIIMQGCLLVDSHKSTGSGPVRSPVSCPIKKTKNTNQKQKQPSKQNTHNHN